MARPIHIHFTASVAVFASAAGSATWAPVRGAMPKLALAAVHTSGNAGALVSRCAR